MQERYASLSVCVCVFVHPSVCVFVSVCRDIAKMLADDMFSALEVNLMLCAM